MVIAVTAAPGRDNFPSVLSYDAWSRIGTQTGHNTPPFLLCNDGLDTTPPLPWKDRITLVSTFLLLSLLALNQGSDPDSLLPRGQTSLTDLASTAVPWHSISKGMMIGGAVAGILVGPVSLVVTNYQAAKQDQANWDRCHNQSDQNACAAPPPTIPTWPEYVIPIGIATLGAGFVLHLITIDDNPSHMKYFAFGQGDGIQVGVVAPF